MQPRARALEATAARRGVQHPSLPSLKLARGPVWKSLFLLGSCTYPTCAALARCHRAVSARVARWRFGGVFLWVGCLRALGAASVRGMDGSLAISMQKEGFPGVLFCLGFHPLQLGRYLFTWLSRVLSDHHHCERQFQLPGSHPQGISDKPTTPHTTRPVVLVWQMCVVAVAGVGKGRDPNSIPAALNLGTREKHQANQTRCRAAVAVAVAVTSVDSLPLPLLVQLTARQNSTVTRIGSDSKRSPEGGISLRSTQSRPCERGCR